MTKSTATAADELGLLGIERPKLDPRTTPDEEKQPQKALRVTCPKLCARDGGVSTRTSRGTAACFKNVIVVSPAENQARLSQILQITRCRHSSKRPPKPLLQSKPTHGRHHVSTTQPDCQRQCLTSHHNAASIYTMRA